MKKLLAVFITILYCFSSLAVTVSAEEAVEINAKNIISNEYGVGFYRINGTDMTEPESGIDGETGSVAFRSKDWLKYDISGLKSGTYEVSVKYASYYDALITIRLNESIVISQAELSKTGSYTKFTTSVQTEKIYINSETKTLKIENENTESISNSSYNINSITLRYIGEEIPEEFRLYTRNVVSGKNGEAFYCGEEYSYDYPERAAVINDKASVIMRAGYWLKYDISHIPQGEYRIALKTASADSGRVSIKINDTLRMKNSPFAASGKYTEYINAELKETVVLPKGNKTLTLINNYSASFNINNLCFIPVKSDKNMSAVIDAANVCGTENEGFFDNRLAGGNGTLEKTNDGYVVLRGGGEWVNYDISPFNLKPGNYDIFINYKSENNASVNVLINGKLKTSEYLEAAEKDVMLLSTYIDGNENIKILNSGINPVNISKLELSLSEKQANDIIQIKGTKVRAQIDLTKNENLPIVSHGVDFYSSFSEKVDDNCQNGFYVLNSGDWAVYDISGAESGMYALGIDCKMLSDGKINVYIDDKLVLNEADLYKSESSETNRNQAGIIYIPEGAKSIKLLNPYTEGIYLKSLSLANGSMYAKDIMHGGHNEAFKDIDAKDETIAPVFNETDFGVTLKSGEWARYNAKGAENGLYDIYVSGTQEKNIYLAIGEDKHFECVINEITPNPVYAGRLKLDSGENILRVENTGKNTVTFEKLIIKKVPYEAEINFEKNSASVGETVKLNGFLKLYEEESLCLKVVSVNDSKEELLKLQDIQETLDRINISEAIEAKADKIVAVICAKDNHEKVYAKAELSVGESKNIYASSSADAGGDGSREKPFNSLETVKNAVRELNKNMSGDIIVNLSGTFNIESALKLTEEDSGTNGYSIIYRGNEKAVISGGRVLPKLEKVSGKELYKTKIDFLPSRQLYINGKSAKKARSENVKILSTYSDSEREGKYDGIIVERSVFGDTIPDYTDMQAVFSYSWHKAFVNITDIIENTDGNYIVKFSQPEFDASFLESQMNSAFCLYFENSPLFLDEQNEWCYVSKTGEVYYYPKRFADTQNLEAVMPVSERLVDINAQNGGVVENIRFEGISFMHGAWNEPNYSGFRVRQAEELYKPKEPLDEFDEVDYHCEFLPSEFSVKHAKNIHIDNCSFSLLGAVALSFRNESQDCSIKNSVFSDVSAAAINIGDIKIAVDAEKEKYCRNISVENNYIENTGTDYPSSPAVTIYYANNINMLHNHIKNVTYSGISVGWGWGRNHYNCRDIKVIGNRIEKVMREMIDGGHIYTLSAMPGTVISGNYMLSSGDYRGGVYLDHTSQYMFIEGNVMEVVDTGIICSSAAKYSKKYNTAENNYSWVSFVTDEPELNNFENVKSMYEKENYENAMKIVREAGIVTK